MQAPPVPTPNPAEVELLRARVQIFGLHRQIADLSWQLASRDLAAAEAMMEAERAAAKETWLAENSGAPMQRGEHDSARHGQDA